MGIVVIGTSFVDVKGFPESSYIPNGRHMGQVESVHGGVARNVAVDIANMELSPTFISTIDQSPMGRDVIERLRGYKVNTEYIIAVPGGLGIWMAIFDDKGDIAVSVAQRPDTYALLTLLENEGEQIFATCDSVVFEMDLHEDVVRKILELAAKHGKKTYAVVSSMKKAMEHKVLFRGLDCLICNEQEAELLFLEDFKDKSLEEIQVVLMERIKSDKISAIIVTRGDKGAVFADIEGGTGAVLAEEAVVKDTTGAGDAFCAGVVAGLTYGKSFSEAIHIGNALAASVVASYENVCPSCLPDIFGIHI